MKTRHEVLIDAPRDVVWAAFDNPDNMLRWQPTLRSFEHTAGTAGQPGATTALLYDEDGREVRMTETITERREPDFMASVYTTEWGKTIIVNHFEDAGDGRTRWVMYANHFFKGVMKIISVFRAGALKNRTDNDLQRFKLLVESEQAESGS